MKNKKGHGPHLEVILRKMCEYVKADYDKINFTDENWFFHHQWYEHQEDKFKEWLYLYLATNNGARKEILAFNTKSKKLLEKAILHFILDYGWRTRTIHVVENELAQCKASKSILRKLLKRMLAMFRQAYKEELLKSNKKAFEAGRTSEDGELMDSMPYKYETFEDYLKR